MTIYSIKPAFQALLRPIMHRLDRWHISANQVTCSAILLSVLASFGLIVAADIRLFWVLPLVLLVRMALNALDGMLARECHQQTRLGAVLNEVGDVISDIALFMPFGFLPASHPLLLAAVILGAVLTEFCGVLAQTINGERGYAGPLGKSDRAFVLGAWGLALSVWPDLVGWSHYLWWIMAFLLLLTMFNRCRHALFTTC